MRQFPRKTRVSRLLFSSLFFLQQTSEEHNHKATTFTSSCLFPALLSPPFFAPLFPDLLLFLQLHYHPLSFCTSLSVAVQFRESTAVSFLFLVQPPLERKKDTNRQQCDTKIAMRPDENDDDNDNDSMMYSRANKSSCRSFGSLCRSFGCKKLKSL